MTLFTVLTLLLAACGGDDQAADDTPDPDAPEPTAEEPGPTDEPEPTADPTDGEDATEEPEGPTEPFVSLTVGTGADAAFINYVVAVEKGFLAEHGIDATLQVFPSGQESLEAVITGQADSTGNGQYNVPLLSAQGADIKVIAEYATSDLQFAAVGVDIEGPEDLPGKVIATQTGTSPDYYYNLYLEHYGVDPDSVEFRDIQFAQLVPALAAGDIDGYFAFGPHVARGIETVDGAQIFHHSGDDGVMPLRVYSGVGPRIYDDAQVAEAFVAALIEAGDWLNDEANKDEAAELMQQFFDIPVETGLGMLDFFDYYVNFNDDALAELEEVTQWQLDRGIVESEPDLEQFVDRSFMEAVAPDRV